MNKQKEAVTKLVKAKEEAGKTEQKQSYMCVRVRQKLPNRPNYRPENPTRPANVTWQYLPFSTTVPVKLGTNLKLKSWSSFPYHPRRQKPTGTLAIEA